MKPSARAHGRVAIALLFAQLLLGSCAPVRPPERELGQLLGALQLQAGMRVADVGAGRGEWSEALAEKVSATGHVFATEVDEGLLERIRERIAGAGLGNVTVLRGDEFGTGLPDACCDAILLRLVYHHLTEPRSMSAELRQALRPGGHVAIVEIVPQKHWPSVPGVPARDGHGISPEDLMVEMESDGWVTVERHDDWGRDRNHYCIIFR